MPPAPYGFESNQVIWDGSTETWTLNGDSPEMTLYWDDNAGSWGSFGSMLGKIGTGLKSAWDKAPSAE